MDKRLLNNNSEFALKRRKRSTSLEIGYGYTNRSTLTTIEVSPNTPQPVRHGDPTPELTTFGGIKLGWVQGVLIPCLLNIWGVMLFLRISWVVAQAGIGLTILIIFISAVVCIITTLSLSAICTNGQLQGGGVYFLVSRSLGAELGASVGIIFAFANAVAASMNTIGFCDSLNDLLKHHSIKIIDNGPNDTRIIGAIALLVMCFICAVGMDWETKTQNLLITIIVTAILNFIIGAAIGPTSREAVAQGFVGLQLEVAKTNWLPDFRYSEGEEHNFFSVFAVYFPAVTGVQAGANICGDLRDPGTAIPKGTLLALAISITSYLTMAILSGVGAARDAPGTTSNITALECKPYCEYGMHNNYQIMNLMALWGPLIYAGCWAATLSTALTNLLSVPRLIQALGFDRIYPGLIFFSKRYGRHGEPYRGYVLTYCVSVSFLLIADLNTIAPLITNFYLASYALINFCTFHAAFFKPISWRPRFRYFNTWLSLTGFILCILIMMIISWIMALITTFIFITFYLLVLYRKPEASWGGSSDAQRYQDTIGAILHMSQQTANVKSFNPQILVMAGKTDSRPWLIDMAGLITSVGSFFIAADIEPQKLSPMEAHSRRMLGEQWLHERKMRAFYVLLQELKYEQGLLALLQCAGLGCIKPNVLFLGYKNKWLKSPHPELFMYYVMIRMGFQHDQAVAIFRVPPNMRPPKIEPQSASPSMPNSEAEENTRAVTPMLNVMNSNSDVEIDHPSIVRAEDEDIETPRTAPQHNEEMPSKHTHRESMTISGRRVGAYKRITFIQNSILDAWWLYDDGGMNILLPYIIARRATKEKIALRIFALPRNEHPVAEAEKYMAAVLKKYRIQYTQLTMVTGIAEKPSDSSWKLYNNLIKNHKTSSNDECLISDEEALRLHKKTCRHLRLRELLIENSFGADLIVMTLPFPRQGISAALYMSWLEIMSHNMPPILFVRGNSTVVIDG